MNTTNITTLTIDCKNEDGVRSREEYTYMMGILRLKKQLESEYTPSLLLGRDPEPILVPQEVVDLWDNFTLEQKDTIEKGFHLDYFVRLNSSALKISKPKYWWLLEKRCS